MLNTDSRAILASVELHSRSLGVDNIGARNEVLTRYHSSGDCVVLLTQFSGKLVNAEYPSQRQLNQRCIFSGP